MSDLTTTCDENFIISTFTWSFSRLNYTCLREFYLNYIECMDRADSFFGQFGTFCHKILEMYAKGDLEVFELSQYYEDHFDEEVNLEAPPNKYKDLKEDYFYKGLEYFDNINLELDGYNILGVEKRVEFEVGGVPMIGYIDLLLEDKATKEITILDHKSGSLKILKSGKISKSDEAHFREFKRQLYLYSKPVIEEYGERVKYLSWNLFKDLRSITIPWDRSEYDEALQWAESTVQILLQTSDWPMKEGAGENDFYCRNLCGQRENCGICNSWCDLM